ncbi:MAG TPA: DUF488 domain-containing protein [Nevskiaceae bacterium]
MAAPDVYTIGHSNRTIDEFIALLREAGVQRLIDIRRLPGSRACPQFDAEPFKASLAQAGIDYCWLQALGGRRGRSLPKDDARNAFWENLSFRHYADYALTPPFAEGLAQLEAFAARQRCAIMCAEAVWWRCHRRIVTDHLLARGHRVFHIMGPGQIRPASLTRGALASGGSVTYPPPPLSQNAELSLTGSEKSS